MILDEDKPGLGSPSGDRKLPKVSIGMPVYNGEKFIQGALDSLLDQTFIDFELIISDNASTDATRQICLAYAAKDERIRYYRNDVRIQPISNFNLVLNYASGQYFMWAAHDDRWSASFVECLVRSLDNNPQAVLAFCRFVNIDDEGHQTQTFKENWADVFSRSKFWQFAFMTLSDELGTQKANHIYGLMRRNALLEYGGMVRLPNLDYSGEDILTLLRLLVKWDFVIVDQILFHYRARSHTDRQAEPLVGYLWQRIVQQKSGHQGNLFLFFVRNHTYHSNMRRLIAHETLLPLVQKLLLWLAILLKEFWFPIQFLPRAVLRELGILRRRY
jgi:glycosyltransferase involved in cell wall biosynthesis